jgi:hypothetical protein
MSIPGWKNFSFFEKEAPLGAGEHQVPLETTCCASGDGEIVFGCRDGTACALDASLVCSLRWPVHSGRVVAAAALPGRRLLVTVGEEEVGAGAATLKLWNLAKIKPSTGNPELVRGVKLFQKVLPLQSLCVWIRFWICIFLLVVGWELLGVRFKG